MNNLIQELKLHLERSQSQEPEVLRVMAKEYLQSYVLSFIYNHPQYKNLAFYGGTCAKIIYGLNRLSEDIDLDNFKGVDLSKFESDLTSFFKGTIQLTDVSIHTQTGQAGISRWTVRLPVLYQLGLSPLVDEKLHLKIEVSNHQQIAHRQKSAVALHNQVFTATHYDLPSLMAGKMVACLDRVYKKSSHTNPAIQVKGRDYYDLIWYMQQQIQPLEEKLKAETAGNLNTQEAFLDLQEKIKQINKNDLRADLVMFFDNRHFIETWLENFEEFFGRYVKFYLKS